ncbi:MAG: transcription elongation factor GreA [Clostridia bacterium]|jgi:transcription elongation factor GreA|nr:transcription elongation factor GreA [Clostridia bacterium]
MQTANHTFLTQEGYNQIKERLQYLKVEKRLEVVEKVSSARDLGDLSENAEYHIAREEQASVEVEIAELEEKIRTAQIITKAKTGTDIINLGSIVKIFDMEYEDETEYTIVGSTEADPKLGKISNDSPVGKSLIGAKRGDIVSVKTPGGITKLKVVSVK